MAVGTSGAGADGHVVALVQKDVVEPDPQSHQDHGGADQVDHEQGDVGKASLIGEPQPNLDGDHATEHEKGIGQPPPPGGHRPFL